MSRPINFRIRENGRFNYLFNIQSAKNILLEFKEIPIWQQATQVKDVSSNMIYEGDILNYKLGSLSYHFVVKFGEYKDEGTLGNITGNGFYLESIDGKNNQHPVPFNPNGNYFRYKIIGNIFDTPELIKTKPKKRN